MKIRMVAAAALVGLSAVLSACGTSPAPTPTTAPVEQPTTPPDAGGGAKRPVVVSSKNFTEETILGELYGIVLEAAGVPVERKLNLGTSAVAHEAMVKGGANAGIDIYPEYTNTGLSDILKVEGIVDANEAYEAVKKGYKEKFNMTWLEKSPMNDTQAMVTSKEVSESKGIKSLADLCAKAGDVTVAAVAEFKDRADALPRMQQIYGGCQFKEIKVFDPNLRYQALLNKQVDIAQAFSTDGEIAGNNLVLLDDPKGYGLPYNVAPVVRDDVLAMYPQIAEALNKVSPQITNEEISRLNWEVAGQGKEPYDVAKKWLSDKNLLPK
jgi:osmoprotectant transport system substrate-binding protein